MWIYSEIMSGVAYSFKFGGWFELRSAIKGIQWPPVIVKILVIYNSRKFTLTDEKKERKLP